MSTRWMGLLVASLACFVLVGLGTAWLLVTYGQALFPPHLTAAPELLTGASVGGLCGLSLIALQSARMRRARGAAA